MQLLRTDEALLKELRSAAMKRLTSDERNSQRVSFIIGSLKIGSSVTRSRIEEWLDQHEGKTQTKRD